MVAAGEQFCGRPRQRGEGEAKERMWNTKRPQTAEQKCLARTEDADCLCDQRLQPCTRNCKLPSLCVVDPFILKSAKCMSSKTESQIRTHATLSGLSEMLNVPSVLEELSCTIWNNREGGTTEELLPTTTQARIDTYPRCIQTSLDTYQHAMFLQSNVEKNPQHVPRTHRCTRCACTNAFWRYPPLRYPIWLIRTMTQASGSETRRYSRRRARQPCISQLVVRGTGHGFL